MKKLIYILLIIGSIFFVVDNVYAVNSNIINFNIGNTNFANTKASLYFSSNTTYSNSITINTLDLYNYYVVYFTASPQASFQVRITGGCTNSCFSTNSYVKQIGVFDGFPYYALVLPLGKSDCGVGTGQCIIENNISLISSVATEGTFIGVDAVDDDNIINNTYEGFLNVISNQNTNSQSIINNQNQNTQSIINNNSQYSQYIIDNANINQQQTNQKLDDVNNSLNSEEAPTNSDVSNKTTEWSSKLAGTGPVSNMVLMPITLLNGYISGFNSTCSPYNLGNLMGTDIILPCINISNYLGSTLWNVIDVLFSGFMIYAIGKKFVKIFNDFTNLRDNQMDELYGGGK